MDGFNQPGIHKMFISGKNLRNEAGAVLQAGLSRCLGAMTSTCEPGKSGSDFQAGSSHLQAGSGKPFLSLHCCPGRLPLGSVGPVDQRPPRQTFQPALIGEFGGSSYGKMFGWIKHTNPPISRGQTSDFVYNWQRISQQEEQIAGRYQLKTAIWKRQASGIGASQARVKPACG
jgi:hypothetical protein